MKKNIWITVVAIVLAAVSIGMFCSCQRQNNTSSGGMIFDPTAEPYDPSVDLAADQTSGIAIPGYSNIYFPADERIVQITLYNPKKNECLFRFELFLDDESDPIATTELVEPGKAVQNVELARPLEIGEYALRIKVQPYAMEDYTPLNNALVYTNLYVLGNE